ncbi:arginase family protein, partial [Gemmatimonadota bacterium]
MQFGDFPDSFREYGRSRVVLLPVPFDKTCSWRKGAAQGPAALLEASYYLESYFVETDTEVYTEGIHTAAPVLEETSESMVAEVERRVEELLTDGKFVVTLGGEHTVSVGAVRAVARAYPRVSVLQLDAHADLRDE